MSHHSIDSIVNQPFDLENFIKFLKEQQIFSDFNEKKHHHDAIQLFNLFDQDKDGKLNDEEFNYMCSNWIEKLKKLKFALVIIDMQNDFIDGPFAIRNCPAKQDGTDCLPIINRLINEIKFDKLFYTLDWHPKDHISFYKNFRNHRIETVNHSSKFNVDSIKMFDEIEFRIDNDEIVKQILWPEHCVENSFGAQLHKDLIVLDDSYKILKGYLRDYDSYSAFFDNHKKSKTNFDQLLKKHEIDVLLITGLAIDYCVGETTKDALDLGYLTILIEDASKGIELKTIKQTKSDLSDKGCLFVNSDQLESIVSKRTNLFEIGLQLVKKNCFHLIRS